MDAGCTEVGQRLAYCPTTHRASSTTSTSAEDDVILAFVSESCRAGFQCVESPGRIIVKYWVGGVVVCLEQGADNSIIYINKLYALHAIFYFR